MSTEGTESTKQAATLSLATQIGTKAINLGLSVLFVRLAAPDCVGLFTLLLASAQLVSSLGRLGMNYSFTVLLPRQVDAAARFRHTSTYSLFSLASSLLMAGVALCQLAQIRDLPPCGTASPFCFPL
jgi:O-antigen/teichoic acid export membrane protein